MPKNRQQTEIIFRSSISNSSRLKKWNGSSSKYFIFQIQFIPYIFTNYPENCMYKTINIKYVHLVSVSFGFSIADQLNWMFAKVAGKSGFCWYKEAALSFTTMEVKGAY